MIFLGNPEFAVPSLEKLADSPHRVVLVVTSPDRRRGRGRKFLPQPVKSAAQDLGLPVFEVDDLESEGFRSSLENAGADIGTVVAFRILPEPVISIPRMGMVNLHASLLPAYRGAAPINWALINGEKKTGLTTFFIRKKVDAGDVLLQSELDIGEEETFGELSARMASAGADLLLETLNRLETGDLSPTAQDSSRAGRAPKITTEDCRVDWSRSAREVHNLIRGLSPRPGAYSFWRGKRIKLLRSRVKKSGGEREARAGEVVAAGANDGLAVRCADGAVELLRVQPEGKSEMSGAEFIRGYRICPGEMMQ